MKKIIVGLVVAMMVLTSLTSVCRAENRDPGGFQGLLTGCCFGLRVGADYNKQGTGNRDFISWFLVGCCCGIRTQEDYTAGKEICFRDWCPIIPYIGIIFRIWDGVDTMNGKVRPDLQKNYGSSYY